VAFWAMLSLPKDVVGHLLSFVSLKDAFAVMLSCKHLCECTLKTRLAPWENNCRGLIHALENGHLAYFRQWIELSGSRFHVNDARAPLNHQFVPLIAAVAGRGRMESVLLMLEKGADPTVDGSAALRYSCGCGQVEMVRFLLTNTKSDPSTFGSEALFLACHQRNSEIVKLLLQDGRCSVAEVESRCRNWRNPDHGALEFLQKHNKCTIQ
jgi:ankyrin repeat protein